MSGVDIHLYAHANAQRRLAGLIVDEDAHRNALDDLDQLPLVFSAGSNEKLEADAGLMLSTVPAHHSPG